VLYSIALPPEMALSNLPAYKLQVGKFVKQIKEELKEAGVLKGKIGIDAPAPLIFDALKTEGINVSLDGLAAMAEARVIKTKDEIELLRHACAICEGGFEVAKKMIRPGVTEQAVWGEICKVAFDLGAEGVEGGHISSGPHSYPIANAISDRIIRPGDIILIDIYNVSYHGYRTCYYRDFCCGEPTQKQKDAWYKARDLTLETISKMKPGASTKDMCENWPKAQDYGYNSEDDATMSQWSHGIRLDQYERPTVGRAWSLDYPEELQEGMAIAVETQWPTGEITGQYPHGQCLRIEEEVVITKNGCDMLTQWPIDEITVCW
jgi:Xaa-Pro aminopeptidase